MLLFLRDVLPAALLHHHRQPPVVVPPTGVDHLADGDGAFRRDHHSLEVVVVDPVRLVVAMSDVVGSGRRRHFRACENGCKFVSGLCTRI